MKKFSKVMSTALACIMTVSVFASCGKKEVIHTDGSYTYWVSLPSAASQTVTSFSELLMYQEIEKRTGTKVEFVHPASGTTGSEAFQILMASGEYPDMMEYNWKTYPGGPDQAIGDGVIIAINDYMKDYAPNYYDLMEGERGKESGYLYKAQSITDAGNYFGFGNLNIGTYRGFGGIYIRKDLLDKWGLEIPTTIDEWTNVFKVAKENGVKSPLTGTSTLFAPGGASAFDAAWKVKKSWYVDNDKIKYGPFEDSFKDYLIKMAEWMKEGYIDPDYITNASINVEGNMTNGSSIASFGFVGSGIGKLLPAMAEKDPNYSIVACPYPVLNEGDTPWTQELQPEANTPAIAVSLQCGIEDENRYKEAIKWCDYLYGDEGLVLKCFGVEGETFTIEKGEDGKDHYIYTDKIYDHEKIGAHSVEAALYHFMRPANSPGLNQHEDYLNGFYPYEQQKEAIVVWNKSVDEARKNTLPPLSYTGEEATRKAQIEAAASQDFSAVVSNIVLCREPIENLDAAIEKAKKAGYDELMKIQQAAYDRYIDVINQSK